MSIKRFAGEHEVTIVRELFAKLPLDTTISTADLVDRTGLDLRVIRDAIAQIIQDGVPILPNRADGGYYITTDIDQIYPEITRLESHSKNINLRADGLRKAAIKMGAIDLWAGCRIDPATASDAPARSQPVLDE